MNNDYAWPVGITSDGTPIDSFPAELPLPKNLSFRPGCIEIDDFTFWTSVNGRTPVILLPWFLSLCKEWTAQDSSESNRSRAMNALDAVEEEYQRGFRDRNRDSR